MVKNVFSFVISFIFAVVLSVLVTGLVAGLFVAVMSASGADVECGSIGFVPYFSGTIVEQKGSVHVNKSQKCFLNGEQVNCSSIDNKYDYKEGDFR